MKEIIMQSTFHLLFKSDQEFQQFIVGGNWNIKKTKEGLLYIIK